MDKRKYWFLHRVKSFENMPYIWGGDDPSGFDCSGMVIEGLKSIGMLPLDSDYTANGLWGKFKYLETPQPEAGCLVFWFHDNDKAKHVAVCLDDEYCLTADGGGRHTITVDDAIEQNAFIKIRRIDHRTSKPKFIRLF